MKYCSFLFFDYENIMMKFNFVLHRNILSKNKNHRIKTLLVY